MITFPILLTLLLPQAQKASQRPIRFPLLCDRNLPAKNTLVLLESPPLQVLEKEGNNFFPYIFLRDGFLSSLLALDQGSSHRWASFLNSQKKILGELKGLDRGFSLSALVYPQKTGKYTYSTYRGTLLLGQSSNRDWLTSQWERFQPLLETEKDTKEEELTLGGSPLVAHWIHGTPSSHSRGFHTSIAYARRGKTIGIHVHKFYHWDWDSATFDQRLKPAKEAAEFNLGAGLGALGLKRGGATIMGLPAFHPKQGTILGRFVSHTGPWFQATEEFLEKRGRGVTPPMMLGFFSLEGVEDTIWTEGGRISERIQAKERPGKRSVFDAFAPLSAGSDELRGILPQKAIGSLRVSIHLPWIKKLFELIQASKRYSVSQENLATALNTIRAILGMPIPDQAPTKMNDFVGSQELIALLALPSPGSFWPEIFLLTPKRKTSASPLKRLQAISQPFLVSLLGTQLSADEAKKAVKILGKGKTQIRYLNYLAFAKSKMKSSRLSVLMLMGGALPGGGKFCVSSNDRFEILSFSPSSLRTYLKGKRTPDAEASKWNPAYLAGEKGELLQCGLNLAPLVEAYPFQSLFLFATRRGPAGKKPKIPRFKNLARLFQPETILLRRLPAKEKEKGVLLLKHQGGSFLSPYTFFSMFFGAQFIETLSQAFSR